MSVMCLDDQLWRMVQTVGVIVMFIMWLFS
ncbi:hypothetical protein BQ6471_01824 [Vibrio gazogenes]|nr:hypothetical protein BQ6471_01824 [Vibrio gazogenes]